MEIMVKILQNKNQKSHFKPKFALAARELLLGRRRLCTGQPLLMTKSCNLPWTNYRLTTSLFLKKWSKTTEQIFILTTPRCNLLWQLTHLLWLNMARTSKSQICHQAFWTNWEQSPYRIWRNWPPMHTVSFDWFLSGYKWILNFEFCLLKLLIFYQKLSWNIRSRLHSYTFWVFEPVFRYVWSKLRLFAQKMKILIKHN